ncbi:secondary thiamine-phosphate synthase enzyme YjbQ [Candidatus Parcubacteria bacterium]|nr:secondary thiamine-phosphate synthase enzyme YjbQ [Candidatus Parcubacteria bacterium]
MIKEFYVSTEDRYQLIDITDRVEGVVRESKVKNGLVLIFVPHSTAGIILTENESGLKQDWLAVLEKLVSGFDFLHNKIDNNADSHILSGLLGQGKTLMIENNRLIRGTWQQIFLVELDGPREQRKIIVKIVEC